MTSMTIFRRKIAPDRAALKAKFDEACARLAVSVKSIANDSSVTDKNMMLSRSFAQFLDHLNTLTKRRTPLADIVALQKIFKNDADRAEPDLSDSDEGYGGRTRRQYYEDEDRRDDDDDDDEKDKTDMTEKSHSLDNIVKRHGFLALAKSVNSGAVTLTEEEYSKALIDDCARRGVSFEKVFCDSSPEGVEIRKGRERCRDTSWAKAGSTFMPLMPTQVGGAAARNVDGKSGGAYEQLMEMARRMKEANPERKLSDAQWFENVYNDPANLMAGTLCPLDQERP
jgi:hypothetical protein